MNPLLEKTIQGIRDYFEKWISGFEKLMEERDRRYEERFHASEKAAETALVAQQKSTDAAFKSAQTAIDKAEQAQAAYNARSNEFRAALEDANKNNISKSEYNAGHASLVDRVDRQDQNLSEKIDNLREQFINKNLTNQKSFEELRIFKGTNTGQIEQSKTDRALLFSTISMIGTVLVIILGVLKLLGL